MWSALNLSGNVTLPAGLVVLDADASVSSLTIPVGSTLMFHPDQTRTLTSSGNIVVDGTLDMSPADATVIHKVHFNSPAENDYVGGGCDVLASDVGLWVTGQLKVNGAAKTSWTRLTAAVAQGATTLYVDAATGWRVGDRLVIAPSEGQNNLAYSDATITAVNGTIVSVTATQKPHAMSPLWNGAPLGAEVLNLTRNVIVEGTSTNKAHVMIHSTLPQTIRYGEFRYLGPRKDFLYYNETYGMLRKTVMGRYALHFHSCQDGSRGSVVEGVAAHSLGALAFVPHASHGVTFRDCVSHESYEGAYWWDAGHVSSDITYERCTASKVIPNVPWQGFGMTAFNAGAGSGNRMIDCVAFGVQGNVNASGFNWPEGTAALISMWEFRGCVTHNNAVNGIFVWQNSGLDHFVSDSFIYNCPTGIQHGAYGNKYRYERMTIFSPTPLRLQARSPVGPIPQRWVDCLFNAIGGQYAVFTPDHQGGDATPTEFHRCTFTGYTASAFRGVGGSGAPDLCDFVDCTYTGTGPRYSFPSPAPSTSTLRFQDGATADQATPAGLISTAPFFAGPLPAGVFVRGADKMYTVICAI